MPISDNYEISLHGKFRNPFSRNRLGGKEAKILKWGGKPVEVRPRKCRTYGKERPGTGPPRRVDFRTY